jgi:hypothetical protein
MACFGSLGQTKAMEREWLDVLSHSRRMEGRFNGGI